jgi:hypothetical protein
MIRVGRETKAMSADELAVLEQNTAALSNLVQMKTSDICDTAMETIGKGSRVVYCLVEGFRIVPLAWMELA